MSERIPPELSLLVLQNISAPLEYQSSFRGDLYEAQKTAKKELANCSLVARSWAGIIIPGFLALCSVQTTYVFLP